MIYSLIYLLSHYESLILKKKPLFAIILIMLDLRDLIIERIEEANNLAQNNRAVSSSSTNNLESECQANRIVLK